MPMYLGQAVWKTERATFPIDIAADSPEQALQAIKKRCEDHDYLSANRTLDNSDGPTTYEIWDEKMEQVLVDEPGIEEFQLRSAREIFGLLGEIADELSEFLFIGAVPDSEWCDNYLSRCRTMLSKESPFAKIEPERVAYTINLATEPKAQILLQEVLDSWAPQIADWENAANADQDFNVNGNDVLEWFFGDFVPDARKALGHDKA